MSRDIADCAPSVEVADLATETRQAVTVFVTVGTDHHPFARLMEWTAPLLGDGLAARVAWRFQTGPARPPEGAAFAVDAMPANAFDREISRASIVVCHAGPGTIANAWGYGKKPVVVPRLARFGECVDDHQLAFARRLDVEDRITLAESQDKFATVMCECVCGSRETALEISVDHVSSTVHRFADLVDGSLAWRP